ncbi:MAG: hypothetical protein P1V81_18045 [Planctomycetota bacterium]|nr:hypothetical protein [Planctomycetota bacterium]
MTNPEDRAKERLLADLPGDVPGLEGLAELPGIVPPRETPTPGPGEPGYEAVFGDGAARPLGWREVLIAALCFLVLAAIPLRAGLGDPDMVQFGLDHAISAEPWTTELGYHADLNAGLSDQAINFYPFYRWVSRSWLAGDPPLWNPLIYCGVPALGNPQAGVLDPQVGVLVLLEGLFGIDGFHWGLAFTAWLRLGLAALGAFCLARRLGLGARGAALAGLTFGFSGYLVLWLNFPLGHVPPFLPWILFWLEGLASPGTGEVSPWPRRRSFLFVALAMLGAVLGGHPETSFFVGVTAGLWCLAMLLRDRTAGLLGIGALAFGSAASAVVLLPFYRYLSVSGAQQIRAASARDVALDLVSLGILLLLGALLWSVLRSLAATADSDTAARAGRGSQHRLVGLGTLHAALVVLVGGGLLLLFGRGLEERFFLTFLYDLWGRPGAGGGYFGPGSSLLESGSTFLVGVALATAVAAVAQRAAGRGHGEDADPSALEPGQLPVPRPGLTRFGLVLGLAVVSLGLALGVPGLVELYRQVPLIGLGDTVRFASVSALMVALLAGEGLEHARGGARTVAVLVLCVCGGMAVLSDRTPSDPLDGQPNLAGLELEGEGVLFGFTARPAQRLAPRAEQLDGWLHPDLNVASARLQVRRLRPGGAAPPAGAVDSFVLPLVIGGVPPSEVGAPAGARAFHSVNFQTGRLDEGWWSLELELLGPGSKTPSASRDLGRHLVERDLNWSPWTVGLFLAGLFVLVLPLAPRRRGELLLGLAALQALCFAEGQNPAYDAAKVFPESATERVLAEHLGAHRYLGGPRVLPPDTGLVRGLRAADGYDALDPMSYNEVRPYALMPGVHPLLGWNAQGVDLASPAFRMLGISMLATTRPLAPERFAGAPGDWQLIASPEVAREPAPGAGRDHAADGGSEPDAQREQGLDVDAVNAHATDTPGLAYAETYIYLDRDPFPRAWCVTESLEPEEAYADFATWDPERAAVVLHRWTPAVPAAARVVSDLAFTNTSVSLQVEVTGEAGATALLVLSEQHFEGSYFEVDGARREPVAVNGLFLGCLLQVGDRDVVLRR